jgi:integrase
LTRTFDRKVDAEHWLTSVEATKLRGEWIDPEQGRTRFSEVATAWLASNPNKRPTTRARDTAVIRAHLDPVIGHVPVGKLRPSHVRAVIERMTAKGLAPRTIKTNYGVLRAIASWAVDDDLIARTPCRGIRLPEPRPVDRPIATAADVRKLADTIGPDYRTTVFLGALGLGLAEVLGLRVGAVDFLRRTLTVRSTINEVDGEIVEGRGKTVASERTISVPQSVLDELAAHVARTGRQDPEALVFQAPKGGPVRAANFRLRVYRAATERAGLDGLSFHRLRHSAGHIMRELGVPLEVIQKRLGHRSIRTTADVYGSLPESVDREVAVRLDRLFRQRRDKRAGS